MRGEEGRARGRRLAEPCEAPQLHQGDPCPGPTGIRRVSTDVRDLGHRAPTILEADMRRPQLIICSQPVCEVSAAERRPGTGCPRDLRKRDAHRLERSENISLTQSMKSLILSSMENQVAEIRAFNRFYTGVIGVVRQGVLDTPYSLTEARVLFELDRRDLMRGRRAAAAARARRRIPQPDARPVRDGRAGRARAVRLRRAAAGRSG